MADDRRNQPIHRTAFVAFASATCDIAAGEEGIWNHSGVFKFRHADGTDTEVATTSIAYGSARLFDNTVLTIGGGGNYTYDAAALTLTHKSNNTQINIDGKAPALNDRVIRYLGDAQDGIYSYTRLKGASIKAQWTRVADLNVTADFVNGAVAAVYDGTTYGDTLWELTIPSGFVMDTNLPVWTQTAAAVTFTAVQTALNAASGAVGINNQALNAVHTAAINNSADTFHTTVQSDATANRAANLQDASGKIPVAATIGTATTLLHGNAAAGGADTFSAVDLAADVTGTLPVANGGTGRTTANPHCGSFDAVPPTAETTFGAATLVTDASIASGALAIAAQPAIACKLNLIFTDPGADFSCVVTIVGVGPGGEAIAGEVITRAVGASNTIATVNAYAKITSVTVSALVGNEAEDHIAIGQASALGLPIPSGAASVVVFKETVAATPAAVPADETVGTVDATARTVIPTTSANGVKSFRFRYSYTI